MTTQKKRILVEDDDGKITRLVRLNLELCGQYEVHEENNANHALTAVRQFRPDLVLLDLMMPGVDGGELASRMRELPGFAPTPIVFLTAAVTHREVSSHNHIGGERFLAKPVDPVELIACLNEELQVCPAPPYPDRKESQDQGPHFAY